MLFSLYHYPEHRAAMDEFIGCCNKPLSSGSLCKNSCNWCPTIYFEGLIAQCELMNFCRIKKSLFWFMKRSASSPHNHFYVILGLRLVFYSIMSWAVVMYAAERRVLSRMVFQEPENIPECNLYNWPPKLVCLCMLIMATLNESRAFSWPICCCFPC